LEEVEIGKNKK